MIIKDSRILHCKSFEMVILSELITAHTVRMTNNLRFVHSDANLDDIFI